MDADGDSTMSTISNQTTGLLILPGEIRNTIYEYVVIEEDPVIAVTANLECTYTHDIEDDNPWTKTEEMEVTQVKLSRRAWKLNKPGLVDVSRQIRREALPVFYAENIFIFRPSELDWRDWETDGMQDDKQDLREMIAWWVQAVGEHAKHVTHVGVVFGLYSSSTPEELEDESFYITAARLSTGDTKFVVNNGHANCTRDCLLAEPAKRFNAAVSADSDDWLSKATMLCCIELQKSIWRVWAYGWFGRQGVTWCSCLDTCFKEYDYYASWQTTVTEDQIAGNG